MEKDLVDTQELAVLVCTSSYVLTLANFHNERDTIPAGVCP